MHIPPDIERLARRFLELVDRAGGTIATAESCTGGQLSAVLTSLEGLSHRFDRGYVTYTERSKQELLNVPLRLIESEGVVSRAVAMAMAEGCLVQTDALCAIAITGFAGPAADDDEAGLVHVAFAIRGGELWHRELHFGEVDRDQVRWDSIRTCLGLACDRMGVAVENPLQPRSKPD